MSKIAIIKKQIMEILEDGQEHSAAELKEILRSKGIILESGSSVFRTAVYQLKNSGINIESKERGIYCLVKRREDVELEGFKILEPKTRTAKKCVYIHEDEKVILNGSLNSEISTRNIEIRITENGEKLALIPNGKTCHRFTKSGHAKNGEIIKMLKKKKIKFPICYEMEKINNYWIGKIKKEKIK